MTNIELFGVGERFSRQHLITAGEAKAFASAAGDDNPLHHDVDVAAASRYGRLIVSGTQTSALLLGLTASHFSKLASVVGVTYTVTFKQPVYMDETVTIEWIVESLRATSSGSGTIIEMTGSLRNDADEVCVAATGTMLASRHPGMP